MSRLYDNLNEVDDDEMWTSPPFSPSNALHAGLREWESSLRCPICHEFFHVPVSVMPCHHSFCSECIRNCFKASLKGLKRSASCPVCREVVNTGSADFKCLIPNRTVETMVKKYQGLRGDLRDSLRQLAQPDMHVPAVSEMSNESEDVNESRKRQRTTRASTRAESNNCDDSYSNMHISETNNTSPERILQRRKKRSTTHYHSLKRKQLMALCEAEGLSIKGTDKELQQRHEDFVTLYNAECDSFTPRPPAELAREIAMREEARRDEARLSMHNGAYAHTTYMERLKMSRKAIGMEEAASKVAVVSSGNIAFDEKMKSNFARLIAVGRQRMTSRTTQVPKVGSTNEWTVQKGISQDTCHVAVDPISVHDTTVLPLPPSTPYPSALPSGLDVSAGSPEQLKKSPPPTPPAFPSGLHQPALLHPITNMTIPKPPVPKVDPLPTSPSDYFQHPALLHPMTNMTIPMPSVPKADSCRLPHVPSRKITEMGNPAVGGPWKCSVCTFINKVRKWGHSRCEMCNSPRTSPGNIIQIYDC